ncbi:MAG TPA: hypothetical protein VMJ35_07720 [Dongiaceae bacterium]|nr:hypothetical protein [Dongiaceae bacterium]
MKKNLGILFVLSGALLLVTPKAQAQAAASSSASDDSQKAVDQNIQLLRQDIRSKKKQLIAANLKLTDDESTKFWPVYDQYTADLVAINNQKYQLIKEYADNWGSMTDAQALDYTNRWLAVDSQVSALRAKYVPVINKVLPGKKTATFFQLERRIQMMIDIQLASQLPIVQAQDQ